MNSIGKSFSGVISGIQKWGLYVEICDGKGEGLVPLNNLKDDNYYFDKNLQAYVGKRYRKK